MLGQLSVDIPNLKTWLPLELGAQHQTNEGKHNNQKNSSRKIHNGTQNRRFIQITRLSHQQKQKNRRLFTRLRRFPPLQLIPLFKEKSSESWQNH